MLGPPSNVRLEILSKHEVFMSWDPPTQLTMETRKDQEYIISWSVDGDQRENIFVPHIQSYTFRNLHAGQLLTAAVRFLTKGGKQVGPLSEVKRILLPGGWSSCSLSTCYLSVSPMPISTSFLSPFLPQ